MHVLLLTLIMMRNFRVVKSQIKQQQTLCIHFYSFSWSETIFIFHQKLIHNYHAIEKKE
jgi:hypothetical protein